MKTLILTVFAFAALFSCGDESDRQEKLDRLKGLGLLATPLVQIPSTAEQPQTVEVEVYLATPTDKTVTITSFEDKPTANAYMAKADAIVVQDDSVSYTDYDDFRLVTFKANVTVPSQDVLTGPIGVFTGTQIRYGFEVRTDSDVEYIVGSFLVYPEGAEELQWQNPTISIAEPEDGFTVNQGVDVDLTATLSNTNDEEVKLGWYASDGKVQNRRALSTTWKAPDVAGAYTVIFTARGRKSRSFALQTITINVN